MSNIQASNPSTKRLLNVLEHHPSLSDALLADYNYSLDEVTTLIKPALQASERCQITAFYIQAIVTGRTNFLATNLPDGQGSRFTAIAPSWLIGRNSTCAIIVQDKSLSRCHAVIGYHPTHGFYITDLSSSNGTQVNRRRVTPLERYMLRDGDLLKLGSVEMEFFLADHRQPDPGLQEATYS